MARVNIFCYADDIALLAPTEILLQYMLVTPAPKLEKNSQNLMLKSHIILSSNRKTEKNQKALRYKEGP